MNISKLKLYFKGFIALFLAFTLFNYLFDNYTGKQYMVFYMSGLQALVVSIVWVQHHILKSAERGCPFYDKNDVSPKQEHTFKTDHSLSEIQQLLEEDDHFENVKVMDDENTVKMRNASIFFVRRDKISIEQLSDQTFKVQSQPPYWFNFIDHGRNIAHIKYIVENFQ